MEILTTLNVVMFVVMALLALTARSFNKYCRHLNMALLLAENKVIQEGAARTTRFKETYEQAEMEHASMKVFWIPAYWVVLAGVLFLWIGISKGIESSWVAPIVAFAAAGIMARGITASSNPWWLQDWAADMVHDINKVQQQILEKQRDELRAEVDKYTEILNSDRPITEEEDAEMFMLIFKLEHINRQLQVIEFDFQRIAMYYEGRKAMIKEQERNEEE